jgi:DNA-binding transcriptional MocR family regulator
MSITAMNWCRELRGLKGTDKSVLHVICDRYNDELGYAWPTIARISNESGWSERTVSRSLRNLEIQGYIASYRQIYAIDDSPASNRYYLPIFGAIPPRGKVFWVGGDFDFEGKWMHDWETTQEEMIERWGQPDTPY